MGITDWLLGKHRKREMSTYERALLKTQTFATPEAAIQQVESLANDGYPETASDILLRAVPEDM